MTMPPAGPATAAPEPLTAAQARVLGSLVEKEATTPEAYPLTANAVHLACNQKTSRDPVMALEPGAVGHALRELEARRLVASVHGARAQRYEHRFAQVYSVTRQQQALLAMLLLRGPQTASELLARCERMAPFEGVGQVREVLERLAQRAPALVVDLGRAAGQREDRFMHLLCGPVAAQHRAPRERQPGGDTPSPAAARQEALAALQERVDALEAGLAVLRERLDRLQPEGGDRG
jgi:uncharacterized protein